MKVSEMGANDQEQGRQDHELDRALDAALATYAAVEPRAGLEDRIFANLRAEQARAVGRAWWRWPVTAIAVALVVVALGLVWKSVKTSHPVAKHPPAVIESGKQTGTQAQNRDPNSARPPVRTPIRRAVRHQPRAEAVAASNPKLDQFPSPQPLSEQEKLLETYVAKFPERAVLLARARQEALRRDQLEEMNAFPSGDPATDLNERDNDTTER
jgi:hypothetical protein